MEFVQQENATTASSRQQGERRLKLILSIVLGLSLLCLTIGIATPGWIVSSSENGSVHYGLFYYVRCPKPTEDKCESVSYIKHFVDYMKESSLSGKISSRREFCLGILREEIGSVLAWLLCLISFVTLLVHRQSKNKNLIDYWLALASSMSVAGVIMGETIYVFLVRTDAAHRYAALDGADGQQKLGFPYAMVFYMIACLLVFMSVVLMFRIFKREVNALRQRCNSSQAYEIIDMVLADKQR